MICSIVHLNVKYTKKLSWAGVGAVLSCSVVAVRNQYWVEFQPWNMK